MSQIGSPGYSITVDMERHLVRLKLSGFWDLETYERYTCELDDMTTKAANADRSAQNLRVLVDLRDHGLQSREVATAIHENLKKAAYSAQRHAVLISASFLHKTQAQRVSAPMKAQFFCDEEEAVMWLLSEPGGEIIPE